MPGMPLPPSAATDEPHSLLWYEQVMNVGVHLGSMTYGAHITCFFMCTYYLCKARPYPWFFQLYIFVLLGLATINLALNINFNELAWIDYRNYPGGPSAFLHETPGQRVRTGLAVGDAAANAATLLVDSLMIYRCYIVWGNNWRVVILPALMLLVALAMGIVRTAFAAQTVNALLSEKAMTFGVPYWALSISLNGIVTTSIVWRILASRQSIRKILGTEHGEIYTGIAAMMIESALPYALVSIVLVVLYGIGNTGVWLLIPSYISVQSIASELIILRVYRGRAWSKELNESMAKGSDIVFNSRPTGSGAIRTHHSFKDLDNLTFAPPESTSTLRNEDGDTSVQPHVV